MKTAVLALVVGLAAAAAGNHADVQLGTGVKAGAHLAQEAQSAKILHELQFVEGAAAKDLKGHPDLLRQEEALLHQAEAKATEARGALRRREHLRAESHAGLLAEHQKITAGHRSENHAAVQTAQGAMLGLASGLESVVADDRGVLEETHQVEELAREALGNTTSARRVEALMSRAKALGRKVMSSDVREMNQARGEAYKLGRLSRSHPRRPNVVKFNRDTSTMEGKRKMAAQGGGTIKASKERKIMKSKVMTTTDGLAVGSDADIQNEVKKMMGQFDAEERRREAYESIHGKGTFKASIPYHTLAQSNHSHVTEGQDDRDLAAEEEEQDQENKEERELRVQARDRHLLRELATVRRDLVHGLRDGSMLGADVAKAENRLISEAERVLQEAHRAREHDLPSVALSQHSSHVRKSHRRHFSQAATAGRGAKTAMRAAKEASKEARMQRKILRETKFAEDEISKLLQGKSAENVRKVVMHDLEMAQEAEKRAINAEKNEAVSSHRAAIKLAKKARHAASPYP